MEAQFRPDLQTPQTNVSLKAFIVVGLAASFYLYEFILQVCPSVLSQQLMSGFQINATEFGGLIAAYYITYSIMQIPAGLAYDRLGARRLLTLMISVCALGGFIFAYAVNGPMLVAGRLMIGFGAAFSFSGTLYLILRWFPPKYFALMAGFTQLLSSVGAITGEIPIAYFAKYFSWRTTIASLAVIGFILAFLVFIFVRNYPKHRKHAMKKKENEIQLSVRRSLHRIMRKPQTWSIALYACMVWAPIAAFAAAWGIPFMATQFHLSSVGAADAMAAVWVGIGIGSPLVGWISDKIKRRKLPLIITALLGIIGISSIIYMPNLTQWGIYINLFLLGIAASGQSLTFALIKDNSHISVTTAAMGLNNMMVVMGGIFFPIVIGKILDLMWKGHLVEGARIYTLSAYHTALLALPLCYVIAALTAVFLIKETHCKAKFPLPKY